MSETITPAKVGRPPMEMTESIVRKLEAALMYGLGVTVACQHAKISKTQYYDWTHENEEFADRMTAAKNLALMKAGQAVTTAIIERQDPRVSLAYLKAKLPEEFNEKPIQIVVNNAIQNTNTAVITPQNPQQIQDWNDKFKEFLDAQLQK